jgi:bifunctional non-homologous end joining protein LigD
MQALKEGTTVRLLSRNGADYTRRFAEVENAIAQLKPKTLHMDGEIVAMDQSGRPSFQALQAGHRLPKGWKVGFYAFDLLQLGNRSLIDSRMSERRPLLQELLSKNGTVVRLSAQLQGTVDQIIAAVRKHGLERVVAKRFSR